VGDQYLRPSVVDRMYNYSLITEADIISYFKKNGIGAHFEFYTTGAVLIVCDIWQMTPDFLKNLNDCQSIAIQLLFKQSKDYKNMWQNNSNYGTYPAEGGLKTLDEVVKLIETKSIHFIMED